MAENWWLEGKTEEVQQTRMVQTFILFHNVREALARVPNHDELGNLYITENQGNRFLVSNVYYDNTNDQIRVDIDTDALRDAFHIEFPADVNATRPGEFPGPNFEMFLEIVSNDLAVFLNQLNRGVFRILNGDGEELPRPAR